MKFRKVNIHPLNKKTGDCVIRALSLALNKSWIEVYDELVIIGRDLFDLPNSPIVYTEYLKRLGYVNKTLLVTKGQKRKKVNDFIYGSYILSIANHLTYVENGTLCDLWDCGNKAVYRYWKLN